MSGKDKITSCVVWKNVVSVSKLPPDSLLYFLKVFLRQEMQIVSLTKRSAERVHLTLSWKLLPVMLTAGLPGSWKIRKSLLQEEIKRDEEREERMKWDDEALVTHRFHHLMLNSGAGTQIPPTINEDELPHVWTQRVKAVTPGMISPPPRDAASYLTEMSIPDGLPFKA